MVSNTDIGLLTSKYQGDLSVTSTIFDIAANTSSTLTVTLPRGYVFYILEAGGVSKLSDLGVQLQNSQGQTLINWAEFPDFPHKIDYLPFLTNYYQNKILVLFTNSSSSTATVTFLLTGILIPLGSQENFEKDLMDLVNIAKILRGTSD